jgi:hypothetical protein
MLFYGFQPITTSYIPNMDPNGMRHPQLLLLGAPELLGHPSKEVSSADLLGPTGDSLNTKNGC